MTNRVVAQRQIVTIGDDRLVSLTDGERNGVVGFPLQGAGNRARDGGDHALQVGGASREFTHDGVTNSIRRLRYRGLPNDVRRRARDGVSSLGHSHYFSAPYPGRTPRLARPDRGLACPVPSGVA